MPAEPYQRLLDFITKAGDAPQEKIALPKWIEVSPTDRPRMLQVLKL